MQGVTTAIVAFIFVCVIWPHLVRNRPQFYAALAAVLVVLLLDSLAAMIGSDGFKTFAYAMAGLLQIAAILLLFLSAGGITSRELLADMGRAIEVIRRGEEEKEIIIPRSDQPRPPAGQRRRDDDEERVVWEIKDEDFRPTPQAPAPEQQPGQQPKPQDQGPLPLD